MPNGLLRVLRHEAFQLCLGALVFKKCRVSSTKRASEFSPGVRRAHVDEANRFNARFGRLYAKRGRGLPALDTAPEFSLRGDNEVLVQRIRRDLDANPLPATGN